MQLSSAYTFDILLFLIFSTFSFEFSESSLLSTLLSSHIKH